jgi:hypothetical protein
MNPAKVKRNYEIEIGYTVDCEQFGTGADIVADMDSLKDAAMKLAERGILCRQRDIKFHQLKASPDRKAGGRFICLVDIKQMVE